MLQFLRRYDLVDLLDYPNEGSVLAQYLILDCDLFSPLVLLLKFLDSIVDRDLGEQFTIWDHHEIWLIHSDMHLGAF